jgi:hypothetical protein
MSPNEIRQIIGMKPSKDKAADELRNRNLSQRNVEISGKPEGPPTVEENQNE